MLFWAITATAAIGLVSLYRIGILSPLNAGWCAAIVILAVYAERHWGAGRRTLIQELEYSIQEIRQAGVQLSVERTRCGGSIFAHSPLEELWRRYKVYADSGADCRSENFFSQGASASKMLAIALLGWCPGFDGVRHTEPFSGWSWDSTR